MRVKEDVHDYRYFPEPDLRPLVVDQAQVERWRDTLPELPEQRRARFVSRYGLPSYDAGVLTQSTALADYFEATAAASGNPKSASNWIMVELLGRMNAAGMDLSSVRISPGALAGLIRLVESGTITGPTAKQVFERMFEEGGEAGAIVESEGLSRVADDKAIDALVLETMAANPRPVQQYRDGKRQAFGFLVGQVMKASKGQADPGKVSAAVRKYLESADKN